MYRVADTIRSTHSQDGAVVLDIRQGQMFSLNPVGSRILQLLEAGATEAAIVQEMTHEFAVRKDVAENDVLEFMESLKQHHFLEISSSNKPH